MPVNPITVMLVDDHALFRAGLAVLINKMPEVGGIVEVGSGQEALDQIAAASNEIDVMILDYTLPDINGMNVLGKVKSLVPEMPVILLSANIEASLIQAALVNHASGFIPKTSSPDVMVSAVQLVLRGGVYIPPEAMGDMSFGNDATRSFANCPININEIQLTQRQMDVLGQMKHGYSNKEIARALNMSPSTVKVHVAAILKELQVASRTQAVVVAKDCGLIS